MTNTRFKRKKYREHLITDTLYNKWINKYPEYKEYSCKQFREYWKILANKYIDIVVTNPDGVRLPFYMGDISIKYTPKMDKNISIHKSAQQGVEVKHMNFTTNGRAGKIIWSIEHARKFNKYLPIMGFEGSRGFALKSTNQLSENPEIFKNSATSKAQRLYRIKKLKNND